MIYLVKNLWYNKNILEVDIVNKDPILLSIEYENRDENGKIQYEGVSFNGNDFPDFLKNVISPVYRDTEYNSKMKQIAIEMTGFDSVNIQEIFDAVPPISNFRIGELIAEKVVESRYNAKFTYNSDRDLKNKRSNNTGADLVGFIEMDDGAINFLFGEVKTSSQIDSPPSVMYGKDGMIDQLAEISAKKEKTSSLVKWFFIKCYNSEDLNIQNYLRNAIKNYSISNNIKIIGVLVRDTIPNKKDLQNRYIDLKNKSNNPNIQLLAVYSNYKMNNGAWKKHI